jgi:tyrosyl-tRNA synthetase
MKKGNVFDVLTERGFVQNCTHPENLKKILEKPVTFYLGIDPTADNLHIGHIFSMQVFKILQDYGHNGILLIGDATAAVGDPSFKNDMRKMLSRKEIDENTKSIQRVLGRFIDIDKCHVVHNKDWLGGSMGYVEFMRNIGQHFTVAKLLSHEIYKNRMHEGELTFLELSYMLMQAYDFIHLNNEHGCILQIGGSDQWANILAGVELGRKMAFADGKARPEMFALTSPLLTNFEGKKMGKTEKGALWVSAEKTSVYDFYQYFINVADVDVEKLLLFFTDLPVKQIKEMCKINIIESKKVMAFAVTEKVHGTAEAAKARDLSVQLFSTGAAPADTPTESVKLPKGSSITDILAATSIISSKREARELLAAGAILIDGEKIVDANFVPTKNEFIIKKGKKTFLKIKLV